MCSWCQIGPSQTASAWPLWTFTIGLKQGGFLYMCTRCFDSQFLLLLWVLSRGCISPIVSWCGKPHSSLGQRRRVDLCWSAELSSAIPSRPRGALLLLELLGRCRWTGCVFQSINIGTGLPIPPLCLPQGCFYGPDVHDRPSIWVEWNSWLLIIITCV